MEFQTKIFRHNGISMSYCEGGEGETIIFLHGWGIRARTYAPALNILARKFHVIAPDLPGFGDSSTPNTLWGFSEYAVFFQAFIKFMKRDVILAGHSTGAGIALYTAAQCKQVEKLILIDAAGLPVEHSRTRLYYIYAKQLFLEFLKPKNLNISFNALRDYVMNFKHAKHLIPFTYKITEKELAMNSAIFTHISAPSLILWGEKDKLFTNNMAEQLKNKLPQSRLQYIPGSHDWIIFDAEQLEKHLQLI